MPLSTEEVSGLVRKLTDKFDEYAYKYSPKYFDRVAFEQRHKMAVQNRMDMEAFILAEITNFEKIKAKYEEKRDKGSISKKIDEMIDEQMRLVKKYPVIQFHARAGMEFPHFLGAINLLAEGYIPSLWLILDEPEKRGALNDIEHELSQFAATRGNLPPRKAEDLLMFISRRDIREVDVERARNNFLKEAAFTLHDVSRFCETILNSKGPLLENPVRFDKLHQSSDRRKKITELFSGHTGYGCALKVKDSTDAIISDFRLSAFRRASGSSF